MSYSSLWEIDKDFNGEGVADFKNSWLFTPVIWSVLTEKYLHKEFRISQFGKYFKELNNKLNNSPITSDRVCWELSGQSLFFAKDKELVADAIEQFVKDNDTFDVNEDGIAALKMEHIQERFHEIAESIRSCDKEYFVFKNTSVDDEVEKWFYDYENECTAPMHDANCDVVIIEDGQIVDFRDPDELMEEVKDEKM